MGGRRAAAARERRQPCTPTPPERTRTVRELPCWVWYGTTRRRIRLLCANQSALRTSKPGHVETFLSPPFLFFRALVPRVSQDSNHAPRLSTPESLAEYYNLQHADATDFSLPPRLSPCLLSTIKATREKQKSGKRAPGLLRPPCTGRCQMLSHLRRIQKAPLRLAVALPCAPTVVVPVTTPIIVSVGRVRALGCPGHCCVLCARKHRRGCTCSELVFWLPRARRSNCGLGAPVMSQTLPALPKNRSMFASLVQTFAKSPRNAWQSTNTEERESKALYKALYSGASSPPPRPEGAAFGDIFPFKLPFKKPQT